MTLEECYLSILKNSNSWNPTNSHTVEFDWGKMKFEEKKNTDIYWDDVALFCYPNEYQLSIKEMHEGDI